MLPPFQSLNCPPLRRLLCLETIDGEIASQTPLIPKTQAMNAPERSSPSEAPRQPEPKEHWANQPLAQDCIPAITEAITEISGSVGELVLPNPSRPFPQDGIYFKRFLNAGIQREVITPLQIGLSLLLIRRLLSAYQDGSVRLSSEMFERYAVVAFLVANKVLVDVPYNTVSYHILYHPKNPPKYLQGHSRRDLILDEEEFLQIIEWDTAQDLHAIEAITQQVLSPPRPL